MEIYLIPEVIKFIESLEDSTILKVFKTIELLKEFGSQLRLPHSKSLGKGLFELRIRGHQETRLFYGYHKNRAVLIHGFIKSSFYIPKKEINLALSRLRHLT